MTRARDLAAFVSNADGDVKFDTDTLFIDSSANRVGISTTTVNRKLEVAGDNNGGAKTNYIRVTDTDTTATAANQIGGIEFFSNDSSGGAGISASIETLYAGSGGGGELTFNTNATSGGTLTEAVRIDENGNVGISETAPQTPLHIRSDLDSGYNAALQLDNNSTTSGSEIALLFRSRVGSTNTDFSIAGVADAANDMDLRFLSDGNTERMRILAGGGLTFNGDTAAANALDDYEEGTWTPTTSGPSLTGEVGVYRKVGKLVEIGMKFTVGTSSSSSVLSITGFPFTNVNSNAARAGLSIGWHSSGASLLGLTFLLGQGTTTGVFYVDGSARTEAHMSDRTVYVGGAYPAA